MNTELCFGQKYDETLGILFPWYSHGVLDVISKWDLSDKVIMEWGSGSSTKWWAKKSKYVYTVDHNLEWRNFVRTDLEANGLLDKVAMGCVQTHEGDNSDNRNSYVEFYWACEYVLIEGVLQQELNPQKNKNHKVNIAIVDGIHRYECAEHAVKSLKPEILIIDNHQQDYVFMCPKLDELLEGVKMERFIQPDHTDHSGNPWATAIFYLNEKA